MTLIAENVLGRYEYSATVSVENTPSQLRHLSNSTKGCVMCMCVELCTLQSPSHITNTLTYIITYRYLLITMTTRPQCHKLVLASFLNFTISPSLSDKLVSNESTMPASLVFSALTSFIAELNLHSHTEQLTTTSDTREIHSYFHRHNCLCCFFCLIHCIASAYRNTGISSSG